MALVFSGGLAAADQDFYQVFHNSGFVIDDGSAQALLNPVLGDANGDGAPDLLAVRRGSSVFRVLFSTRRERWASPVSIAELPEGVLVQDILPCDIDADGDVDLVFWALEESSGNAVFGSVLGDGFGAFSLSVLTSAPAGDLREPDSLSDDVYDSIGVGDTDGDGTLDLVIASDGLVVLTGNGIGGFGDPVPIGQESVAVEVLDLDGDGVSEIIAGDEELEFVFYDRDEQGWFVAAVDSRGNFALTPTCIAAAPTCDGGPGTGVAAIMSSISLEYLTVSSGLEVTSAFVEDAGSFVRSVAIGDILGAPSDDFVMGSGRAFVDVGCEPEPEVRRIDSRSASKIGLADIGADGNIDLVTSERLGIAITRVLGDGVGRSVHESRVVLTEIPGFDPSPTFFVAMGVAAGDFDGDGRPDVFVSTFDGPGSAVFYQELDGTFEVLVLSATARAGRVHAADVDGDGHDDVVLPAPSGSLRVNFAGPGRVFAPPISLETATSARDVGSGDVDGDGLLDLVAQTAGGFTVFRQVEPRQFTATHSESIGSMLLGIAVGDLNGDGFDDVIVGAGVGVGLQVSMSHGDGTFEPAVSFDPGVPLESLSLADLDGDGDLDVVVVSQQSFIANVFVYENDGLGGFTRVGSIFSNVNGTFGGPQWVEVERVDADGFLDIVIVGGSAEIQVIHGGPSFSNARSTFVQAPTQMMTNQFAMADFDRDGFVDIAAPKAVRGSEFDPDIGGVQILINRSQSRDRCPADLALPGGVLDLNDIVAFVTGFNGDGDPADADLAAPFGILDLDDIVAFVTAFLDGCD